MRDNSKSEKWLVVVGSLFVIIGVLCNEWVLTALFSEDGVIKLGNRIIIWTFDLTLIFLGVGITIKRKSLNLKTVGFYSVAITLMFILIEIGLHVSHFVIDFSEYKDGAVDRINKKVSLSPFKDKEWSRSLWEEFYESKPKEYEQFIGWARREYNGKYINVNSLGVRKTWNPALTNFDRDTIFMYGGSTLWGMGARDEHTIPSYLSKELNKRGYNSIVMNHGEGGYKFLQEIIHLVLLLRSGHRPDYVIFYDGVNDIYGAYRSGVAGTRSFVNRMREKLSRKELSPMQHMFIGFTQIITKHSMVYRAVFKIATYLEPPEEFRGVAARYNDAKLERLSQDIFEHYSKSIQLLGKLSQVYGFKYLCLWQPVAFTEDYLYEEERQSDPRLDYNNLAKLFNLTNEKIVSESFPHLYNISNSLFDRKKTYYIDFAHLSEEGNSVIAERMFSIFEKEYLIRE